MLMGELATLVKYKLPVKVIVIKNNVLGQIKWEQMVLEGNPRVRRRAAADRLRRRTPRRAAPAGFTIDDPDAGRGGAARGARATRARRWSQAVVDPNEPPMPGHVTMKQALHFAEALVRGEKDRWDIIKTVLKDKVREVGSSFLPLNFYAKCGEVGGRRSRTCRLPTSDF